ncbi:hypothetical protein, partial [Deinococcus sp.]|uniref:hypothetical protein n=1 Tax=Deinococcus sp. TaxID=47478 RepID=UPI0028698264
PAGAGSSGSGGPGDAPAARGAGNGAGAAGGTPAGTGAGGGGVAPAGGAGAGGGAGGTGGGNGGNGGVGARAGGGGAGAAASAGKPLSCTVLIDVRGLGNFQRDMTSAIYDDQGRKIWPDAALIRGVSNDLVQEGNLHTYITSESQIASFPDVTRIRASRIQPNALASQSSVYTDVSLSVLATALFKSAGQACRVVYLKD